MRENGAFYGHLAKATATTRGMCIFAKAASISAATSSLPSQLMTETATVANFNCRLFLFPHLAVTCLDCEFDCFCAFDLG